MDIRRILLATDMSDNAALALKTAVALARRFDAELEALHVVERLVDVVPEESPPEERQAESLFDEPTLETLRNWIGEHVPDATGVVARVEEGDPAAAIVARARALEADLIVMGTHGHSAIERFFLGTTVDAVLRNAPCPVLAVPTRREARG